MRSIIFLLVALAIPGRAALTKEQPLLTPHTLGAKAPAPHSHPIASLTRGTGTSTTPATAGGTEGDGVGGRTEGGGMGGGMGGDVGGGRNPTDDGATTTDPAMGGGDPMDGDSTEAP